MTGERERTGSFSVGPEAFSDGFATGAATGERHVEVIHGIYAHSLPLAGMTVAAARAELEHRMNIDPDAVAVIDGHEADEDAVLQERQVLNFVKRSGEKG